MSAEPLIPPAGAEGATRAIPQAALPGTTVEEIPRLLIIHRVTDQALDALASTKTGLGLTFFGITIGASIAFWIVLKTVPNLPADSRTIFFTLTAAGVLLTLFFGLMSLREGLENRGLVKRIRERPR